MIDLRSDTVTLPSTEMKQFLFHSPLGDDVYGEDPSVNLLEKKVSDLFGKEDALFVPSGTMANLISVLAHCNWGDEVILGDKSHIFLYEAGGISAFGGIHSYQLENHDNGTINTLPADQGGECEPFLDCDEESGLCNDCICSATQALSQLNR